MNPKLNGVNATKRRAVAQGPRLSMPAEAEKIGAPQITETKQWTQAAHERLLATRHERVSLTAYYLAETRGFVPGFDGEDWLRAQSKIDAQDAGSIQA